MIKLMRRALVIICIVSVLCFLTSLALSEIDRSKKNETYKELELFADALAYVQSQYVKETSPKDLLYGAMTGMLNTLDPHSQFLTPDEYNELKVETEGKFGGIGIEITIKDSLVTIITPIEGTPAWEAGLQTNDRIVKIDDVVAKDFTLNEAVKKLRGQPGSEVDIVIWREKEGMLHSYKIKRALIEIKDIKEAGILEDNIAYVKLVEFRENTPQELDQALKDLKSKGMESLILDLRNNPGGLLDKAVEATERFLAKGSMVVSIKGRDEKQNADFKSNFKTPLVEMPMIVLVNEGSASGSEILAGALQDHKRAIILGTKTFGKGSVQSVLPLRDGSALRLTTSRYFTPLGRTIQDTGISPDIAMKQQEPVKKSEEEKEKEKNMEKVFENVEGKKAANSEEEALQKRYTCDTQLSRAVDLLKSIKVYKNIIQSSAKTPVKTP